MPVLVVVLLALLGYPYARLQGQSVQLGPADSVKLQPTDTGRVAVGSTAPDFALESLAGPPVTLSQFRGKQNVVLVFYRGHW